MGGICSGARKSYVDDAIGDNRSGGSFAHANGHSDNDRVVAYPSRGATSKVTNNSTLSLVNDSLTKDLPEPLSYPETNVDLHGLSVDIVSDGIPSLSRALSQKSRSTKTKAVSVGKVSEVGSLLNRAGTAGLGKAVEVLDTLGSSVTSLNIGSAFTTGVGTKGTKISILAFEVANTIVKGAQLMQSLSEDNIKHLKEEVLLSEGVRNLISRDMDELLRTAALDKREELKVFSSEVVRFGNRCKDPQWHNLQRYFEKLSSEVTPQAQLKVEAEAVMHQLLTLVHHTAELYHELQALDRLEQDYCRRQQEEDNSSAAQRGDSIAILKAELKSQKKHVRSLKKKSLWSKILEEVMEKLVDIVHYLHLEIHEAFCSAGDDNKSLKSSQNNSKKLGCAGLALHYANIISQIDTLGVTRTDKVYVYELLAAQVIPWKVSRSSSMPPNTRDALYQGLPPSIKAAFRSKLQSLQVKEELTIPEIKAEMEKTLHWLVPIANNTTKAHHGFGWVGEWANTGSEINRKASSQTDLLRIETLHHADKEKTEQYMLELVVWLHHLVYQARLINGGLRSPVKSPIKSPMRSPNLGTDWFSNNKQPNSSPSSTLTIEDREMLREVSKRKLTPGISKSQEFDSAKTRLIKNRRLSKSSNHSPTSETKNDRFPSRRPASFAMIDFDIDRIKVLDVIDRVYTIRSL